MLRRPILLAAVALVACAAAPAAARAADGDVWSGPPDAPAGVLVLHGGAWYFGGPELSAPAAARYAEQGARVLNAAYTRAGTPLESARAAFDALDAAVAGPICIAGDSSGGHVGLLLALERPVACVLARAAPTDLTTLRADGAHQLVIDTAEQAFGDDLAAASPQHRAADLTTLPLVLATATADPIVPVVQQQRLAAALPQAELFLLPDGDAPFVHRDVDAVQLDRLQLREHAVVSAATGLRPYVPRTEVRPKREPESRPPPPPPEPQPDPPPPPPAPPPPAPRPPALGAPRTGPASPRAVVRAGLLVRQDVTRPGRVSWRVELAGRVVGRAARTVTRAGHVRVRVRASRAGRAALRRAGPRARLTLVTRLAVPGGAVLSRRDVLGAGQSGGASAASSVRDVTPSLP